jgi:hypothetical protein
MTYTITMTYTIIYDVYYPPRTFFSPHTCYLPTALSTLATPTIHHKPTTSYTTNSPHPCRTHRTLHKHCSLQTIRSSVGVPGTVNCALCTIHCALYTIHCIHFALCTIPMVHCTLYTVHYTLYTIHYTPYTIHHTPYTVHCTNVGSRSFMPLNKFRENENLVYLETGAGGEPAALKPDVCCRWVGFKCRQCALSAVSVF